MKPTIIPQTTLGKLLIIVALSTILVQNRALGFSLGFLLAGSMIFVMLLEVNESVQ